MTRHEIENQVRQWMIAMRVGRWKMKWGRQRLRQVQVEVQSTSIAGSKQEGKESESVRVRVLNGGQGETIFQSHENQTVRLGFSQVKETA